MDELKPMYDPPHPGELLVDVCLPALGASAESWLAMQNAHDLWVARRTVNLDAVRKIGRALA
ncbi:MAG: hypothetical protein QM630_02650 [Microbacterium sp.]